MATSVVPPEDSGQPDAVDLAASLSTAGYRLADFSPDEQSCISGKIRALVDEGRDQNQAVAMAIAHCAPGKSQRSAVRYAAIKPGDRVIHIAPSGGLSLGQGVVQSIQGKRATVFWTEDKNYGEVDLAELRSAWTPAEGQFSAKAALPGGAYRATQRPDGTWTIHDVPVFAEHGVELDGQRIEIGEAWMRAALARAQQRLAEDAYLPPLHVYHHGSGKPTARAGFFRPRRVARIRYQGRAVWTLFADLVGVPMEVYDQIRSGALPYRSVEVHRIREPEVDSLALLPDEVPYFRLPLLTIGREEPIGQAERLEAAAVPLLAYRSLGSEAYSILYGDTPVRVYMEHRPEDQMQPPPVEPAAQRADGDAMAQVAELLGQALAILQGGEAAPVAAPGPAPVEMSDRRALEALARATAAEARVAKIEARETTRTGVAAAVEELTKAGHDGAFYRDEIATVAAERGLDAVRVYIDALKRHARPDPAPTLEAYEGGVKVLDTDMQEFAGQGAATLAAARKYADEYDALSRRMRLDFPRTEHVRRCLEADGTIRRNGR